MASEGRGGSFFLHSEGEGGSLEVDIVLLADGRTGLKAPPFYLFRMCPHLTKPQSNMSWALYLVTVEFVSPGYRPQVRESSVSSLLGSGPRRPWQGTGRMRKEEEEAETG